MTELELYKFVQDHDIEYHWHDQNVLMFIDHWSFENFCELLGHRYLTDGTQNVVLKYMYITMWMREICGDFDIDMEKVFIKK